MPKYPDDFEMNIEGKQALLIGAMSYLRPYIGIEVTVIKLIPVSSLVPWRRRISSEWYIIDGPSLPRPDAEEPKCDAWAVRRHFLMPLDPSPDMTSAEGMQRLRDRRERELVEAIDREMINRST